MSSPLDTFATGTYTVTRRGAPSIDDATGYETEGSASTFTIEASIQPASGKSLQGLDAGQRQKDPRECWTETLIRTADEQGRWKADLISVDGKTFQVQSVQEWGGPSFPHYEAMLLRMDPA